MRRGLLRLSVSLTSLLVGFSVFAADLEVILLDEKGMGVGDAVVYVQPLAEDTVIARPDVKAEIRQQDILFHPFVLPVHTGDVVTFPNMDEIRHHVYSFSDAKTFELRLYGQDETQQVVFDKPGIVALGCNIHDNMLAYVYITDAPAFAKTTPEGRVVFDYLPDGDYKLYVWHPDQQKASGDLYQSVTLDAVNKTVSITMDLRSVRRGQMPPDGNDYN